MPSTRATRKRLADELPAASATTKRRAVKKEEEEKKKKKNETDKKADKTVVPRKPTLFDELDGSPAKKTGGSSNIEYLQSLDDDGDSSLSELDDGDFEEQAKPKTVARGRAGGRPVKKEQTEPTKQKGQKAAPKKAAKAPKAKVPIPKPPKAKASKAQAPPSGIVPRKPTLFDDLDTSPAERKSGSTMDVLKTLDGDDTDGDVDGASSSLSDMDVGDVDFEDVPLEATGKDKEEESDDDDDDVEFEDVEAPASASDPAPFSFRSMAMDHDHDHDHDHTNTDGNLELTLVKDTRVALTTLHARDGKRAPSKMERLVRSATHCVHVQALLYHNALRNAWLCDAELQGLLLSHVPPRLLDEVDRWGGRGGPEMPSRDQKNRRSWNTAKRVAQTTDDLRHNSDNSDPLPRLLRMLAGWWRRAFRVTAPGLRKTGYMPLERLDRFLTAAKDARGIDTQTYRFGERISNVAALRAHAAGLYGSRDVGAQLFTALLRALGLEARMVASLQPLGFGWSKLEDADEEGGEGTPAATNETAKPAKKAPPAKSTTSASTPKPKRIPTRTRPSRSAPVVNATDNDASAELEEVNSDNDSVSFDLDDDGAEHKSNPRPPPPPFDQDLPYAVYWTEVLSPARQTYIPVDALVRPVVATTRDLVEASFEPRGSKAEKARQVIAYVVGHAADGTAKDVTVRYLKRQMRPGRTRGVRWPVEKVPVYNKHGKVRRYDVVDWFGQAVMRGYVRGGAAADPVTAAADAAEDAGDLRPAAAPATKEVKDGDETLQYYKQSPTYVLARHLKREEALVEGAVVVKRFNPKKKGGGSTDGDADSEEAGEPVYLRKDVVPVKSAETWHKQGRAPKPGAVPLKHVPYRAATLNRKREIAEAEAATGAQVLQALFSKEQTDWIIPPPIGADGVIPKNAYGNIDLFAPHMCPQGAVHVPFRGAARVCRKLGVDYAEAVVDFEFGHRMAVPVIQGVVVAAASEQPVLAQLRRDEAERARKDDEKRRAKALATWRRLLMGLRVVERIRHEYGEVEEVIDLEGGDAEGETAEKDDPEVREQLPEGYEYEEQEPEQESRFFPVHDDEDDDGGGGFVVE